MSQLQGSARSLSPTLARLPHLSPSLWVAAAGLAAAVALLPSGWSFRALAGLLVSGLVLARPELAVYLLALAVPLGSLMEMQVGGFSVTPTEGLAGLLAVGWIARSVARGRMSIPMTPLTIPLVAMVGVVALSAYQATELAPTIKETLKWLELALVYLFIVAEMGTIRQARLLLVLLLAGAAVEALMGLVQFGLGIGPGFFAIGRFMRAYGTFEQPNPYAGYLGMLIPLAVGLLLARPASRIRYYALGVCLLAALAVGMSLSRGAWVGIALGVSAMMVFWSHRSRLVLGTGGIAVVPLGALAFLNLLPAEVVGRLATAADYFRFIDARTEVVTPQNWAVIERVAHWQAALDMVAKHPLLGVGAGNYPAVYEWYAVPGWWDPLGHAHNFYLNIAAETGITGLLIYLAIVAVALLHTMRWLVRSGELAPGAGADLTPPAPLPDAGRGETPRGRHPSPRRRGAGGEVGPASGRGGVCLLWRGILLGVLGALVASSMHNMFDSLFVHSMSVQLGMILALGQLSANALSITHRSP